MENEHCKSLLKALKDRNDATIRSVAGDAKLTERECSIAASLLVRDGFLSDVDDLLEPSSTLKLTDKGVEQIKLIQASEPVDFEVALKTHLWQRTGSHATGAGQITKDKWYPMGSFCRKCGLHTRVFKKKPVVCPKK